MSPTIRDVALRAGVAPSSVTRVLGNYSNVTPEMRERVMTAVREVGYQPDLLAAGLRRGYTKTVGVLVNDVLNPAIAEIIDAIESDLRLQGYGVLLANSHGEAALDVDNLRLLSQRRVDALIASVADDTNSETIAALSKIDIPTVLLDRDFDEGTHSSVITDHRYAARLLTDHLLDNGHRRIAIISGPVSAYPSRERVASVVETMRERGLDPGQGFQVAGRGSERFGAEAVGHLLEAPEPPSAVIVGNGNSGAIAGVLTELRRRGVRIGADIAVAVAEDGALATLHTPALTAVRRDIGELGRRAARMVLTRLSDASRPTQMVVLPAHLVVRESTDWTYRDPGA